MILEVLFNVGGVFVFIFLFWRKLKEDYISAQIFSSAIIILLGISIAFLISKLYFPQAWFWMAFFGFIAGFLLSAKRSGLRIYEAFETALISVLPWLSFLFLIDSINNTSWYSLVGFLITLGAIFLYIFLNSKYKYFSWYKSGRIGFAGLTSIGVYFLTRGVIAFFFPFVLSFVGNYEPILSGVTAFAFFLMVFNLSRADS
jgi:hypothetical protein